MSPILLYCFKDRNQPTLIMTSGNNFTSKQESGSSKELQKAMYGQWFFIPLALGGIIGLISGDFLLGIVVFFTLTISETIHVYLPYANDNPQKLWFKRKIYGWGWVPVTWQGWSATALYSAVLVYFTVTLPQRPSAHEIVFDLLFPIIIVTLIFIYLAYKKGERPKWQWGIKNKKF
mgnify:CR=1 FL=1